MILPKLYSETISMNLMPAYTEPVQYTTLVTYKGSKRYKTTVHLQPRQVPTHYSSTIICNRQFKTAKRYKSELHLEPRFGTKVSGTTMRCYPKQCNTVYRSEARHQLDSNRLWYVTREDVDVQLQYHLHSQPLTNGYMSESESESELADHVDGNHVMRRSHVSRTGSDPWISIHRSSSELSSLDCSLDSSDSELNV